MHDGCQLTHTHTLSAVHAWATTGLHAQRLPRLPLFAGGHADGALHDRCLNADHLFVLVVACCVQSQGAHDEVWQESGGEPARAR